jgi:DNA-binding XRE family transcriptional regulator
MTEEKPFGRPPYKPNERDARQVETLVGMGLTQESIARLIEIDKKTLIKYYRKELDSGADKANAKVAQSLFKKATEQMDTTAQIWWTKARMKWSGEQTIHHTGINIKVEDKEDTEL